MLDRLRFRRVESYEEMRQRLVHETSAYLTECLRHPELIVRIPMIEAGRGNWPPSMTASFWDDLLDD